MLPENLPLIIPQNDREKAAIERTYKNPKDLQGNLLALGQQWKIKVWFSKSIRIQTNKRVTSREKTDRGRRLTYSNHKEGDVHIFPGFFTSTQNVFCYRFTRTAHRGQSFPSLESVLKYEIISDSSTSTTISAFDKFHAKFDLHFITETEIKDLWNSKSSQHGSQYLPSDFRTLGKVGRDLVKRFLIGFKGINNTDKEGYTKHQNIDGHPPYYNLSLKHYTRGSGVFGRDISISHTLGRPYVSYASEYPRCGNGRYGLIVNKNEYLWLEDD